MKVMLISSNIATTPFPVYPLGLSMIAAALQNEGHDVCQFDFLQSGKSFNELEKIIREQHPEIIGISIRNIDNVNILKEELYIKVAKNIVKKIRQLIDIPIILGGSGFTIMPEAILSEVGADYGIVGEGESTIIKFINEAAQGIYPDKGCITTLDKLPGRQIPKALYDVNLMEFYLKSGNMASVQTKRGCPHKCIYCSYPFLEGSAIRCRDPEAVVDDIESLIQNYENAKYIFFVDSVFNDSREHYLDVLLEMKKRGIKIPWSAFFTPSSLLTDEKIELMKETGLAAVEIGADAATDNTLKKLGKSFLFKNIIACNELFNKYNIPTAHYFMFGSPGETQKTTLQGISNIKNLKETVSFIYMGIRILPSTSLAEIAEKENLLSKGQELLDPVYYISPKIDKKWLEETLNNAFSGIRNCIFPPDSLNSSLEFLHKRGIVGPLWDMILAKNNTRKRRRVYGK